MAFDLDAMAGRKAAAPAEVEKPVEEEVEEVVDEVEQGEEVAEEVAAETEETETAEEGESKEEETEEVDLSLWDIDGVPVSQMLEERTSLAKEKKELEEAKNQLEARLNEIESDPWLKNFLDVYKTGSIEPYLATKIDWDKKDDLTVLRHKFEKENSDLEGPIMEIAFKRELKNKYGIDASDEDLDTESDDYKMNQALQKRDASKARQSFKEEQSKYLVPERKVAEVKPQQRAEEFKKVVLEHQDVKNILEKKLLDMSVKSGAGDNFNYELENASPIVEMMYDEQKFWSLFLDQKTGQPDLKKVAKVFAYASDMNKFEGQIFEWGKKSATETIVKEKKNIDGKAQTARSIKKPTESATRGIAKAFVAAGGFR